MLHGADHCEPSWMPGPALLIGCQPRMGTVRSQNSCLSSPGGVPRAGIGLLMGRTVSQD